MRGRNIKSERWGLRGGGGKSKGRERERERKEMEPLMERLWSTCSRYFLIKKEIFIDQNVGCFPLLLRCLFKDFSIHTYTHTERRSLYSQKAPMRKSITLNDLPKGLIVQRFLSLFHWKLRLFHIYLHNRFERAKKWKTIWSAIKIWPAPNVDHTHTRMWVWVVKVSDNWNHKTETLYEEKNK